MKNFFIGLYELIRRESMRVENYGIEATDKPEKKKKSSVKKKNGAVVTTTVTKENGITTEITETTYPDGRIVTKKKSSGCGVHNIGVIHLGTFNLDDGKVEAGSIFSVKDENAELLIGDELKSNIDKNGQITINDIVDSDGKVKPDYRIFDLNGDGRLADNEFDWFAHGGAASFDKSATSISADNFKHSVEALDTLEVGSKPDGIITNQERVLLHSMLDAPEKFY